MTSKTVTVSPVHEVTAIFVELAAVGIFTLIAGISNDVGTLVVIFMVGMWLIFLITNPAVSAKLGKTFSKAASY